MTLSNRLRSGDTFPGAIYRHFFIWRLSLQDCYSNILLLALTCRSTCLLFLSPPLSASLLHSCLLLCLLAGCLRLSVNWWVGACVRAEDICTDMRATPASVIPGERLVHYCMHGSAYPSHHAAHPLRGMGQTCNGHACVQRVGLRASFSLY
jgi:hypothetical protein